MRTHSLSVHAVDPPWPMCISRCAEPLPQRQPYATVEEASFHNGSTAPTSSRLKEVSGHAKFDLRRRALDSRASQPASSSDLQCSILKASQQHSMLATVKQFSREHDDNLENREVEESRPPSAPGDCRNSHMPPLTTKTADKVQPLHLHHRSQGPVSNAPGASSAMPRRPAPMGRQPSPSLLVVGTSTGIPMPSVTDALHRQPHSLAAPSSPRPNAQAQIMGDPWVLRHGGHVDLGHGPTQHVTTQWDPEHAHVPTVQNVREAQVGATAGPFLVSEASEIIGLLSGSGLGQQDGSHDNRMKGEKVFAFSPRWLLPLALPAVSLQSLRSSQASPLRSSVCPIKESRQVWHWIST